MTLSELGVGYPFRINTFVLAWHQVLPAKSSNKSPAVRDLRLQLNGGGLAHSKNTPDSSGFLFSLPSFSACISSAVAGRLLIMVRAFADVIFRLGISRGPRSRVATRVFKREASVPRRAMASRAKQLS